MEKISIVLRLTASISGNNLTSLIKNTAGFDLQFFFKCTAEPTVHYGLTLDFVNPAFLREKAGLFCNKAALS